MVGAGAQGAGSSKRVDDLGIDLVHDLRPEPVPCRAGSTATAST